MILYDSILASGHGIYGVFSCVFFWMGSGNCFDFDLVYDGVCEEG